MSIILTLVLFFVVLCLLSVMFAVMILDQLRQVIHSAALDVIQIRAAAHQAQLDIEIQQMILMAGQ